MDLAYTVVSKSPEDTHSFGQRIALEVINGMHQERRVICLRGNLGSGKTVFVKGFLSGFGVTPRILSPTFTIEKTYEVDGWAVRHFDLYRLKNASEISNLGMKDTASDKNTIVLIEWAEKMQDKLPSERIEIDITLKDDLSRVMNVHII